MIFKYLSYRKIKNLVLLWSSYHLSYFLKQNFRWGNYISLSIEPTNSCNLSCPECPTGTNNLTRKLGLFSIDAFKTMIETNAQNLIYLNFYFQGEPFLNKQTTQLIEIASQQNIYTSSSTNAQLIDKELANKIVSSGLNRIIISIDGSTQEIYEKYRKGGRLNLVIEATKNLLAAKREQKSDLKVIFQFLVFRHNEHQIEEIKQLGSSLGVDKVEIKSAQIYNFENSDNIPRNSRYSRYKRNKEGKYEIKSKLRNKCWRMWHSAVVTQDLQVVPCCFDKDADNTIGNLNQNTIQEIEVSSKYKKFRQHITDGKSSISICNNCTEGLML